MSSSIRNATGLARPLSVTAGLCLLLFIAACKKQEATPITEAAPKTFVSPDEAGRALADATKSQNQDAVIAIMGPGSSDIVSSGDVAEDKAARDGFAKAYQVMNRWRKMPDGSEVLLVGAENQAFPIPLLKSPSGQWYFDAPAGRKEILVRRIGRNELSAIYVCGALTQSQIQYFSEKHDGTKQYADKFISDPGKQNGLYWEPALGGPRSPLGPLVAYASEEGMTLKPNQAHPYYGYFYRNLEQQGPAAKGGAKPYIINGKMTGGFAYIAYPAKYAESGIKTFIINQDGVVFEKDLGPDTTAAAKTMSTFNPDTTWTELK
jgi:hypothetical protein